MFHHPLLIRELQILAHQSAIETVAVRVDFWILNPKLVHG
jgi:hypothetical protein